MEMVEGGSSGGDGQVEKASVFVVSSNPVQVNNTSPIGRPCTAAEKTLKRFAAHLSKLEKITSYHRRVETLWASMVLLSGFGSELSIRDFWFSTSVLFINNIQLLNKKYADDEEQQDGSSRVRQSESRGFVQNCIKVLSPMLFPFWRIVITLLITVKLTAAIYLCIRTGSVPAHILVASGVDPNKTLARNKKYSLLVLYALVISECFLFLFGDLYYLYKIYFCKQLHGLSEELKFGSSWEDMEPVRGFFIDSIYSRDPERDMVTYAVDLLSSNSRSKELLGVRIMTILGNDIKGEILRNIGANSTALNTLVRMLKWDDQDKRISAAKVLSNLAKVKENSIAIAGMLGPIKAISYLFECEAEGGDKDNAAFIDLGLQIIEKLAHDQDNCEKIGKTNGLLGKLVSLTKVDDQITSFHLGGSGSIQWSEPQNSLGKGGLSQQWRHQNCAKSIQPSSLERSLKVLKLVTTQRGITWKNIRREISEMSLVKNIQVILAHTESYDTKLQRLALEVLSNLAEENNAKECIGDTPGVLESLGNIFFGGGDDGAAVNINDEQNYDFRLHAGKVLQQLAKKSKGNCLRILKMKDRNKRFKEELMKFNLSIPRRITVARLLLHLCINSGESIMLQSLLRATSDMILQGITDTEVEVQDVMVGITAFGCKVDDWIDRIGSAGINKHTLANKLKEILMRHKYDISKERPNVCDLVVEMALLMVKNEPKNIQVFREVRIQDEMKDILETTTKIKEMINILESIGKKTKKQSKKMLMSTTSDMPTDVTLD